MITKLKITTISLLAIATLFIASNSESESASASVLYTWSYDYQNIYNYDVINYSFSSLSSAVTYRWDMYGVDPRTGNITTSLGFRTFSGGTSTMVAFGGAEGYSAPDDIFFPTNFQGPIAIVDSGGTILGRHYVAQGPTFITSPDSSWFDPTTNTSLGEKMAIGGHRYFDGFCEAPVYAPVNADGWQHTFRPCSAISISDGYAILHYQIDVAYTKTTHDKIRLYQMPTSTEVMTIDVDDLIDYQTTSGTYIGSFGQAYSFVIINTSGIPLPFIDYERANTTFLTNDNPLMGLLDPGVYNYTRTDSAATWIADGESVWIVSDDPQLEEWRVTSNVGDVGIASNQTLVTHAVTPEVWTAYHGYQLLADSYSGYSNGIVYAFANSRPFTYQVSGTPATGNVVQWINRASAIFSGAATPEEMEFEVQTTFNIVTIPTFEDKINQVIVNTGLDTNSGSAALLVILLAGGMLITAAMSGLRGNPFIYMVVWTGIGSTYVIGGFGTTLVDATYIVFTIALWVFMLVGAQGTTDESA